MTRRIGILTYFETDNPGTFLQAYAMLTSLRRRFPGDRVELIDCRQRRSRFRPHRRDLWPPNLIEHVRRRLIYNRCRRQHFDVSPRGIVTFDYDEAAAFLADQGYDLIVVGSDTVFQMRPFCAQTGRPPIYWLPPDLTCLKVACAASGNMLTGDSVDEPIRQQMAASIQAFDVVGVRDDLTLQLMEALGLGGDRRLVMVPDPTFTLDLDPAPAAAVAKCLGLDQKRPVLGVSLPTKPLTDALVAHFRAKGFQAVSFGAKKHGDLSPYALSPFAWAGLYGHFRLTLTDRFHGTVMCLLNATPVVAVDCSRNRYAPSGLSKTYTLMRQFGMERTHHVNLDRVKDAGEVVRLAEVAMEQFDAAKVRQTVAAMRARFFAFLDRVAGLLDERNPPSPGTGASAAAGR